MSQLASPSNARNPNTNGAAAKGVALLPTNTVNTNDGVTVRARIDPTLTVEDVVRQLCINLKIRDSPAQYALRDENGELVTNDNLRKKIKAKQTLKLGSAPAVEAKQIVEKLTLRDEKTLRLTLFSLQKFIKEDQFVTEFLLHEGLRELVDIIDANHGNTLAYALTAMQNLMDLDYGWASLDEIFIFKVVEILSSPHSLINVCRPATAILKKLVEADPLNSPGLPPSSGSRGQPMAKPGSVFRYGFALVYEQMRKEKALLETVVNRLGSADTAMALNSMMLINSLLSHASERWWVEFVAELERLNIRKAIVRLMSSHTIDDLTSCILDFQANMVRVAYRKKTTLVDPDDPSQADALDYIWECAGLEEEIDPQGGLIKWRKLGFDSEDLINEFADVGVLGLDCLKNFVQCDPDYFSKVVFEQISRPAERRCPIAKASNELVEVLLEYWQVFAPGYSTSTTFQPFFLNFPKVHYLAVQFFHRMWNESGASSGDVSRVAALARSQVKVALRRENSRPWHEVEADFLECEYRAVRDRQMKELEMEDDLLNKVPVRNLRAKLYKESYEFVRQQRVQCLLQGAWFVNALPITSPVLKEPARRPSRPWRFLRLDNGFKYLHYVDSAVKFPIRSGLEDLPDRIEISTINEIATGTSVAPPRDAIDTPSFIASPLSFSLINSSGESLADQIASDKSRWADWTDGLNMLRKDGGHVASSETAEFVEALTEIGLRIKLLDLSGEMVDIPSSLIAGPPPTNTDFFFSDLM